MTQKQLEQIVTRPALWLILFGGGTIMTIAAVASAFGGAAAGTVAGFLTLAGTLGYESLCRQYDRARLDTKIKTLHQQHEVLHKDAVRTRSELEFLQDDLAVTARSLQQQARKLEEHFPTRKTAPASKQAAPVPLRPVTGQVPKNFQDLHMMAAKRLANTNTATPAPAKVQKTVDNSAPVPKFSDPVIAELLHHAIEHDRIETFAQPIVKLPSRKLAYLELFARIRARAGIYLPGDQYRELAEQETLISQIDHILLTHTLESIRADARRDAEIGYFLNISSRTFKDMAFISVLLEFLKSNRDLAHHLIFELQQADFAAMSPAVTAVMKGLAKVGCLFSIDHVDNPQVDAAQLRDLNVRFLKIDKVRLARLGRNQDGIEQVLKLKQTLKSAGVTLIAERIETDRDLKDIFDFEIDLGEGFLFGKPDLEIAYRSKKVA